MCGEQGNGINIPMHVQSVLGPIRYRCVHDHIGLSLETCGCESLNSTNAVSVGRIMIHQPASCAVGSTADAGREPQFQSMMEDREAEMKTLESFQDHSSKMFQSDEQVFDHFRRWGYLTAQLDPLGQYLLPQAVPGLEATGELAARARRLYCGTVGVEFMHITDPVRRQWIQDRFEQDAPEQDHQHILDLLIRADVLEQVLQSRYPRHQTVFAGGEHGAHPFSRCVAASRS